MKQAFWFHVFSSLPLINKVLIEDLVDARCGPDICLIGLTFSLSPFFCVSVCICVWIHWCAQSSVPVLLSHYYTDRFAWWILRSVSALMMNPSPRTSLTPCPLSSPLSLLPVLPLPPVADVFTRNPLPPLPLLLGKMNLGQSLLLNEFYSDKLLPFPLQRQLQSTQPFPQPGTPPHSRSDWLTRLRLQHF